MNLPDAKAKPKAIFAVVTRIKPNEDKPEGMVWLHRTKASAKKHLARIAKVAYSDEKAELLEGSITWQVIDTVKGELERGS